MAGDGGFEVNFNINADEAEKELERLKKKIIRLESALTEGTSSKNTLAEKLKEAKAELERIKNSPSIKDGKFVMDEADISRVSELNNIIAETESKLKKQNDAVERTKRAIEGAKAAYAEMAKKMEQPKTGFLDALKTGLVGIIQLLGDAARRIPDIAKALGSGVLKGVKGIASATARATKSLVAMSHASKQSNNSMGAAVKNVLRYGLGIRSLFVLFNRLRRAMMDGIKNIVQYSSSVNSSVSSMKSALTQLKNSFATAFAPIITNIAPVITAFINMISRAVDSLARLIAMLSGQSTYIRATKVQEDYAKSLDKTSKSANKAAKSMASFDTINQLANKDSSGSGGGGSVDPSKMFETVSIEPLKFDTWGQAFSAMLDSILKDGIPRLEKGLLDFTTWLNGFSAKLYEMFTFPGVYDKVVAIGTQIALALNNAINNIDWATLGGAIGAGLNLALGFVTSFIYTFDWGGLGAHLASAFNGMVAEIDWYSYGQFLWSKFKIGLETFAGFMLNLDMKRLAQAASNIAKGFFDSMSDTIQNIDWFALGEQVKEFLVNIDWAGVATSVFTAIGSAFGAAAEFLWGLIHDAWQSVIDWWHETAYEDGQFTFEGLLEGIKEKLAGIGLWIKENILDPFLTGFKDTFGIHSPSTVMAEMGGYLIQGLEKGIADGIGLISNAVSKVVETVKPFFSFSYWLNIGKEMMNGLISAVESGLNWIIDKINGFIESINRKTSLLRVLNIPSIPTLDRVTIPRLAKGAVIPPNREFMAVLGDQKQGTNIETPLATMVQAFKQALAESGYGGGSEAYLMLDRDVLGKVVYRLNHEEGNRVGVSLTGV